MIYCIEDDDSIRNLIVYTLKASGFDASGFACASAFWEALKDCTPELVLLDIMLPDEDGIMILKKFKKNRETAGIPVIFASAKGTEYDKVIGLDLGADDYLAKPFGMMEMVSRVKAVLRRSSDKKCKPGILHLGKIVLSPGEHMVTAEGEHIALTLKEYELLKIMMESPGLVFTREQLMSSVWGDDFTGESRTVDVHVGTLRTKLGDCGRYIKTIRGVGYKMEKQI